MEKELAQNNETVDEAVWSSHGQRVRMGQEGQYAVCDDPFNQHKGNCRPAHGLFCEAGVRHRFCRSPNLGEEPLFPHCQLPKRYPFVTSDGRDFIDVLHHAFRGAEELRHCIEIVS